MNERIPDSRKLPATQYLLKVGTRTIIASRFHFTNKKKPILLHFQTKFLESILLLKLFISVA